MSEECEAPEPGAPSTHAPDATALALSLSGASRERADAFLDDQRRMLHLQMEEMRAEEPFKLSNLRLRRFSSFAKAALEASLGLIALALVGVGIAQFTLANGHGPHFADPLEGWGEALMAKNQSHLAVAKFAEAEKYAPNWGRLQLKWGEALTYAARHDEAAKHFARAAALDLTPSEKSELANATTRRSP